MTIKYIDNATITFVTDSVSVDFQNAASVAIDLKITFEGSLDRRSNVITATRSANIDEPITIDFVLKSACATSDGSTVIDKLHILAASDRARGYPSKGTIKIIDNTTGETRSFAQAILTSDPEYLDRTIERGGTGADYNVKFICADEVIN